MRIPAPLLAILLLSACHRQPAPQPISHPLPVASEGYVAIEADHFSLDGEPWFPLMLNYKAFFDGEEIVPAPWYTDGDLRAHFDTIASWGFNAVRLCLDSHPDDTDTAALLRATHRAICAADSAGLRVMLLIKPPFEGLWRNYAVSLFRTLSDLPALFAYDLMNEPLYFDPLPERPKTSALRLSEEWCQLVRRYAPHQLFTIATAEPIEVFEWDPSLLPIDFIEMHTYHPLRVQSEMYWYSRYCGKPWMVGETGLPADDDSVPYAAQAQFIAETYAYARLCGAAGFGWWEFQDYPAGINFEAQYTGLRTPTGIRKPAVKEVLRLLDWPRNQELPKSSTPLDTLSHPANYYNMLAYCNLAHTGCVVAADGRPIEGAVVRGWNEDWSVGMNTFTDSMGHFRLVSNDLCTHFEISAPGYDRIKFDHRAPHGLRLTQLPDRKREYQSIPLLGWGDGGSLLPTNSLRYAASEALEVPIGKCRLRPLL